MRDRLLELLPFLLVGLVLLIAQLTRPDGAGLAFLSLSAPPPTPTVEVVAAQPRAVRAQAPVSVAGVATESVRGCTPEQPRFIGKIAMLRAAVGSSMGDPLECEQSIGAQGDTQQRTTTGLAYRHKHQYASFTTGWEHWALRDDGAVVFWAGDAVDPPLDAVTLAAR